ncbi:Hpt domain-containing protein [Abyssalbus ytuae]|uniref:Hpt domain-containing protein n=1 Tax=Abyssalbus ytuae TaxID=2926907 RepID=A0A9E6ZRC4_9FLAO|nr:Hpt domain-containing protein [Abyssalbus ytuae]UOB19070.1 Hpt domain-containing protein [Abyssalbus ytuae]
MTEQPNLSYIDELSGGDEEFKNKMLSILKKELPEEKEYYLNTIKNKDFGQSAQIVHKIKHKISILGMEKTYTFAEKHEDDLKGGVADFHPEFLKILEKMSNFLMNV